jgi:hypothetical protein
MPEPATADLISLLISLIALFLSLIIDFAAFKAEPVSGLLRYLFT